MKRPKPRLRYRQKTWDCGIPGQEAWAWGFGYTAKQAYDNWLDQMNRLSVLGGM